MIVSRYSMGGVPLARGLPSKASSLRRIRCLNQADQVKRSGDTATAMWGCEMWGTGGSQHLIMETP